MCHCHALYVACLFECLRLLHFRAEQKRNFRIEQNQQVFRPGPNQVYRNELNQVMKPGQNPDFRTEQYQASRPTPNPDFRFVQSLGNRSEQGFRTQQSHNRQEPNQDFRTDQTHAVRREPNQEFRTVQSHSVRPEPNQDFRPEQSRDSVNNSYRRPVVRKLRKD